MVFAAVTRAATRSSSQSDLSMLGCPPRLWLESTETCLCFMTPHRRWQPSHAGPSTGSRQHHYTPTQALAARLGVRSLYEGHTSALFDSRLSNRDDIAELFRLTDLRQRSNHKN